MRELRGFTVHRWVLRRGGVWGSAETKYHFAGTNHRLDLNRGFRQGIKIDMVKNVFFSACVAASCKFPNKSVMLILPYTFHF